MRKNPSTRWFFKDWAEDEALRCCSLAAQGLWMRMLCLCAENQGYVLINGQKPTRMALASWIGISWQMMRKLMLELEQNGVFSRTHDGVIFNRRMARDAKPEGSDKPGNVEPLARNTRPRTRNVPANDAQHANGHGRAPNAPFFQGLRSKKEESERNLSVVKTPQLLDSQSLKPRARPDGEDRKHRSSRSLSLDGRSLDPLAVTQCKFLRDIERFDELHRYERAIDPQTGLPPDNWIDHVAKQILQLGWREC